MFEVDDRMVLVTDCDVATGTGEKMRVHYEGMLHRAFSVFLFDDAGRMLLQRRASTKYHSPGLWSNACCGHPRLGEAVAEGASRRLHEELGIHALLERVGSFRYRAELANGLIEHEIDHVFVGRFDGDVKPNPAEVDAYRWIEPGLLREEMAEHPSAFTSWFGIAIERFGLASANRLNGKLFIPANERPNTR